MQTKKICRRIVFFFWLSLNVRFYRSDNFRMYRFIEKWWENKFHIMGTICRSSIDRKGYWRVFVSIDIGCAYSYIKCMHHQTLVMLLHCSFKTNSELMLHLPLKFTLLLCFVLNIIFVYSSFRFQLLIPLCFTYALHSSLVLHLYCMLHLSFILYLSCLLHLSFMLYLFFITK